MIIDTTLFQTMLAEAASNERLRVARDLRTGTTDTSQRILNAILPGSVVPIHRHPDTVETIIVLQGAGDEVFYDEQGTETHRVHLSQHGEQRGMQVPIGAWHTFIVTEPSVIVEVKDGAYQPISSEDIKRL